MSGVWADVAVVVALLLALAWYLSYTAARLDRLHARVEGSLASLDAQLVRRAEAAAEYAQATALDPASSSAETNWEDAEASSTMRMRFGFICGAPISGGASLRRLKMARSPTRPSPRRRSSSWPSCWRTSHRRSCSLAVSPFSTFARCKT